MVNPSLLEVLFGETQGISKSDAVVLALHYLLLQRGYLVDSFIGCEKNTDGNMMQCVLPARWNCNSELITLAYKSYCGFSSVLMKAVRMSDGEFVSVQLQERISQSTTDVLHFDVKVDETISSDKWDESNPVWKEGLYRDLQALSTSFSQRVLSHMSCGRMIPTSSKVAEPTEGDTPAVAESDRQRVIATTDFEEPMRVSRVTEMRRLHSGELIGPSHPDFNISGPGSDGRFGGPRFDPYNPFVGRQGANPDNDILRPQFGPGAPNGFSLFS